MNKAGRLCGFSARREVLAAKFDPRDIARACRRGAALGALYNVARCKSAQTTNAPSVNVQLDVIYFRRKTIISRARARTCMRVYSALLYREIAERDSDRSILSRRDLSPVRPRGFVRRGMQDFR